MTLKNGQESFLSGRTLVWFSRGAASAVAAKMAVDQKKPNLEIIYCDTSADEDEDNQRFQRDVEQWIQHPIKTIASAKYKTADEVFADTKYISGTDGARCTGELKRVPRIAYQWAEDVHVFGYTLDETMPHCKRADRDRIANFEKNNPLLHCEWLLCEAGLFKDDCLRIVREAGLKLPIAYEQGFEHANCKGCVKATSPHYWNLTRKIHPQAFELRAARSRALGVRLVRYKGERIFLDELPPEATEVVKENLSCGPQCQVAEVEP